jgi:hypothetical protein
MNLERQVKMMEQQDFDSQEDLGTGGKVKNWIQDNIRIIISVLIVVAIAGGIYSYSNRGQAPSEEELALEEEFNMENQEGDSSGEGSQEGVTEAEQKEGEQQDQEEQADSESEEVKVDTQEQENVQEGSQPTSDSVSEETEDAFIETAVAGDSKTTLARKALKSYLEKNQDSELTPEHKIYIEDYLRKNVDHSGGVNIGSQMTFSKNLIKDAIEKSKTLNENQLENLKKYSAMVSNL